MMSGTYTLIAQADTSWLESRYFFTSWSPNSLYYAFTYTHDGSGAADKMELAFYSLETDSLTSLFTFSQMGLPSDLA